MGFDHISDLQGFDHMLFIVVLCAIYTLDDWKKVSFLITAFTIGHSITLALSSFKIISVNPSLVEVLIPCTILFTSLNNLVLNAKYKGSNVKANYLLALFFGFIHGMGFSNYFNALMIDSMNILFPLFSFNLGLEIGQLMIIFVFFLCYFLAHKFFKINQHSWTIILSGAGGVLALVMIIDNLTQK